MKVIGPRKYVEIPGDRIHELPPLLVKDSPRDASLAGVIERAESIVVDDWLLPDDLGLDPNVRSVLDQRRTNLAVNLAEQYAQFLDHWAWGESILEWIRQCEITFGTVASLRPLLRPDVWPHAGRASFVTLLEDKKVSSDGVNLENAMGYRLTFREPPPIRFFSDKFLFLLSSSMASGAYKTWAATSGDDCASLPPERFRFFVTGTEIREV